MVLQLCRALNSVVNFIFPSVEVDRDQPVLRFGGRGYGVADANAGLRCGVAITTVELAEVLNWLALHNRTGFFDADATLTEYVEGMRHRVNQARYVRSLLFLDLPAWRSSLDSGDALELAATRRRSYDAALLY